MQDFTARGRIAVQGTAMVEQLLRVVKVLVVQQKDGVPEWIGRVEQVSTQL